MHISNAITKRVDSLYIKQIAKIIPHQLWRYGLCGALNMMLDSVWYFLIYHFVVCKHFFNLGSVVISPHIASLALVFPITFFTGFWLNRNVAFHSTATPHGKQLWRYAISVVGAIVINYVSMKFLVEICSIWPTPAKSITTIISSIYSFLAAKFFTFRTASN